MTATGRVIHKAWASPLDNAELGRHRDGFTYGERGSGDEGMSNQPGEDRLRLVGIEQVARFLGTTVDAIYRMRARGDGPPAYRIGRHLRFRWADIRRWQQQHDDR